MPPTPSRHVPLTSFDARTAEAVVAVLSRHGVPAAARPAADDADEVEVTVPEGAREDALRVLGTRMEEVREAAQALDARGGGAAPRRGRAPERDLVPPPDPDDVHAGPPLVMERFRSLSWLTAVVLVPLLAVTIAGPLTGDLRLVAAVSLMVVVGLLLWRRRRR